jgi:predicted aconitase with swiveling domain
LPPGTTAVLLEAIRQGTAPRAIITINVDKFFTLAAIVAEQMYAITIPQIGISEQDFAYLKSGMWVEINVDGVITLFDA